MRKNEAGIDGIEFDLNLNEKQVKAGLENRPLKTLNGTEYGRIEVKNDKVSVYLCLPKAIRENNVTPFGLTDMDALPNIRKALKRELDSIQSNGDCSLKKIECNLTKKTSEKATPDQVLNLIHHCYPDCTNIVYEGPSKGFKYHKEKETLIIRKKNYYILKCYNKTLEQKNAGNNDVENNLLRIEIIMQGRTIQRLFGCKCNIFDILQECNLKKVIAEYARIFSEEVIGKHIIPGLRGIKEVLLESLMDTNELHKTVEKNKEIIVDDFLWRVAIKKWDEMWDLQDSSRQRISDLKYLHLPKDVIKTIEMFQESCGICNKNSYKKWFL